MDSQDVKTVPMVGTRVPLGRQDVQVVLAVSIKIKIVKRVVNPVLSDNIRTQTSNQGANRVLKVTERVGLGTLTVLHVRMVNIQTRLVEETVRIVAIIIIVTLGSHHHIPTHLTNIRVTSIEHAVLEGHTGRRIVIQRAMHKGRQALDMVITGESVVTTSRIISMNLIGGQAIMQQVIVSVLLRQAVGSDLVGLQE